MLAVLKRSVSIGCILLCMVFLFGCATSVYRGDRYQSVTTAQQPGVPADDMIGVTAPLYYGYGEGTTEDKSTEMAKRDAIIRSVLDLLQNSEAVMAEKVRTIIQNLPSSAPYVLQNTYISLDKDFANGNYQEIAGIRINLAAVVALMKKQGITGGYINTQGIIRLPDMEKPDYTMKDALQEVLGNEQDIWQNGWKPVFLVYYVEDQETDPFTMRSVVLAADDYIASLGFEYISLNQIEQIKNDQSYAFAEETGSESMLRWIASRLNADYYIDVAVKSSSSPYGSRYKGEATISLSCFDSSTASGRGSVVFQSKTPVYEETARAAEAKAVSVSMNDAMKQLMEKVSTYFSRDAEKGTNYDIIIMKTSNDKMMREFKRILETKVSGVKRTSFSVEETRYVLQFNGSSEELEDLIYSVAEAVQGMEDLYLLYQRGNSLTYSLAQ